MKKFLVVFVSVIVFLVSVFAVSSFAGFIGDDPDSLIFVDPREVDRDLLESSPISDVSDLVILHSGDVFLLHNSWGYLAHYEYFPINFELGSIIDGEFVSAFDYSFYEFIAEAYSHYYLTAVSDEGSVYIGEYVSGSYIVHYPALRVLDDTYVSDMFLDYYTFSYNSSLSSPLSFVFDFWLGALNLASSLIDFISSHWIAIIPLVLWVLIALFGVFRRLFKGV